MTTARRIFWRRAVLGTTALVGVALAVAWSQRQPIARDAIDRALRARGVEARYKVAAIGFRDQRLERVVIGNPAHPDLTADRLDVQLAIGFMGVSVRAIEAEGVRLRGTVSGGQVRWGAIDKLLPATAGKPITLPDIDMTVRDTVITLVTPVGAVAAQIEGRGRLSDGFRGRLHVLAPALGPADCHIADLDAMLAVVIARGQPHVSGPARAGAATCGGVQIARPRADLDVLLGEALNRWRGSAVTGTQGMERGSLRVAALAGRATFAGTPSDMGGQATLIADAARFPGAGAQALATDLSYRFAGNSVRADGVLRAARVLPDPAMIGGAQRGLSAAAGSPAEPLARALAAAVGRAGEGAKVEAGFSATRDAGGATIRIDHVTAQSRSGATLRMAGGEGVRFGAAGLFADTRVSLGGGGMPEVSGTLRRLADGTTQGMLIVRPYAAGGARLALTPLRFAARADGTVRIESEAVLDGPLGGGRISGLRLPLAIQRRRDGMIVVNPACAPVSFTALSVAGLALDPARITLCPADGALARIGNGRSTAGGNFGAVALSGRSGQNPVTLGAQSGIVATQGLSLAGFAARIGNPDRVTRLDIATLQGHFNGAGIKGSFAGLAGEIGRVPLRIGDSKGGWRFARGTLDVDGALTLTDAADAPRFAALVSEDAHLRLSDGHITAGGTLREPMTKAAVLRVAIDHALGAGSGEARLAVDRLTFDRGLQPDRLTRLTVGVIANVAGTVNGAGNVRWTSQGVTSDGAFTADGLDFAAAFGPVQRLAGTIHFDDLIALSTPPGQRVTIAVVNPGVEVKDGVIAYRLRPQQRIEIESGRWPFAGGELLLDPAVLDMAARGQRKLTFRVTGLDAARFIEQLKFQDIAATGIFDGALPMIFDDQGGRIEGGRIVVRPGGGTLAYVGDVSNAQMNMFAKLAFDALKAMRYDRLAIDLDGALDGEIVSKVSFNGVNQAPVTPGGGGLARQFTGLPFLFNVTIRAPFRGLLNTARTFQDPSSLIKTLPKSVQPPSSGKRP